MAIFDELARWQTHHYDGIESEGEERMLEGATSSKIELEKNQEIKWIEEKKVMAMLLVGAKVE